METTNNSVVVGILCKGDYFLAAQRPKEKDYAGFWEFPGGKVEKNETLLHALFRELKEELNISIASPKFFCTAFHSDETTSSSIHFFTITKFTGTPIPMEGQVLQWITLSEFKTLPFLETTQSVLVRLKKNSCNNRP